MTSEELTAIADEFAAAITAEPRDAVRLATATGNLLMAMADQAAVQSAGVVVLLIKRIEADDKQIAALQADVDVENERIAAIERSRKRNQEVADALHEEVHDLSDRLAELEREAGA
jgi:chromosome segregation ATPase